MGIRLDDDYTWPPEHGRYSAKIDLQLIVAGLTLSVSACGPEECTLDESPPRTRIEPQEAILRMTVDDAPRDWKVFLFAGIDGDAWDASLKVPYRNVPTPQA